MWPSSSVVVVLPLVPVTATKRLGIARQASSSSPITSMPRSRAAAITGASRGTPGLLTTVRVPSRSSIPSTSRLTSTPAAASPAASSGMPGVATPHPLSARGEQPRRGRPGAGQPDDQERPLGQRRAGLAWRRHAHGF